jgi:UDP-N-acetylglucosamine 2-epimerase (non-hydrolysing)
MGKLKIVTVVGTRPEIIRLSRLIPLLDQFTDHVLVHTGQNYDPNLSEIFFKDLEVREPDHYLGIKGDSLGQVLGNLFPAIESVLTAEAPDAVLILGDTNSSLSAIIAERMGITVYHMEAGNRSFDVNVPEELNRKLVDHVATFNLAYTEFGRRNLLAEGVGPRFAMVSGSPMGEVLEHYRTKIHASRALETLELSPKDFFLASFHREENVDNRENLKAILHALGLLSEQSHLPVVVSVHPRTAKKMESFQLVSPSGVRFLAPLAFTDYCRLQSMARCVISDSGTISEEAAIMNFPAVTIRKSMERPEALEAGVVILSGLTPEGILGAVEIATSSLRPKRVPVGYESLDFSSTVLNQIISTVNVAAYWTGKSKLADHS